MRILSGVQPSGRPHLGNYFGAMRQFVNLQHEGEALYFIADLHALTSVRDGKALSEFSRDVALDYLALGLDPAKATLFLQSDIPEVTELFWYLTALTPMGLLERGHSYKDKVARGIPAEAGIFTYPVLMAADILLYGTDLVPVGKDQVQHLEMTRDIATKFNAAFVRGYDPADPDGAKSGHPGILKLPKAYVQEGAAAAVPGVDGQKMSKSYGNTIELFADDAATRKKIMGIKSDSTAVEAPKDPDSTPIFALLCLFASPHERQEIEDSFKNGGKGYGHYKLRLYELFLETLGPARQRRRELASQPAYVDDVLATGAKKAREMAAPFIDAVRQAVGTGRSASGGPGHTG